MAIAPEIKITWKEEKENLHNDISTLRKSMTDFKTGRKSDWKSFKRNFKEDMGKIEQSLKKLTDHHKK